MKETTRQKLSNALRKMIQSEKNPEQRDYLMNMTIQEILIAGAVDAQHAKEITRKALNGALAIIE